MRLHGHLSLLALLLALLLARQPLSILATIHVGQLHTEVRLPAQPVIGAPNTLGDIARLLMVTTDTEDSRRDEHGVWRVEHIPQARVDFRAAIGACPPLGNLTRAFTPPLCPHLVEGSR